MSNALDTAALSSLFPSTSAYAAQHAWVPLAAAALLGLGQETHVAELCGALLSLPGEDEVRLMALRRLREAMLKASPLVGFPRVRGRDRNSDLQPRDCNEYCRASMA